MKHLLGLPKDFTTALFYIPAKEGGLGLVDTRASVRVMSLSLHAKCMYGRDTVLRALSHMAVASVVETFIPVEEDSNHGLGFEVPLGSRGQLSILAYTSLESKERKSPSTVKKTIGGVQRGLKCIWTEVQRSADHYGLRLKIDRIIPPEALLRAPRTGRFNQSCEECQDGVLLRGKQCAPSKVAARLKGEELRAALGALNEKGSQGRWWRKRPASSAVERETRRRLDEALGEEDEADAGSIAEAAAHNPLTYGLAAGRHLSNFERGFAFQIRTNTLGQFANRPGCWHGDSHCPMPAVYGDRAAGCRGQTDGCSHLLYACAPFRGLHTRRHNAVAEQVAGYAVARGFSMQTSLQPNKLEYCVERFPAWVRGRATGADFEGAEKLVDQKPDLCFWNRGRTQLLVVEVGVTAPGNLSLLERQKRDRYEAAMDGLKHMGIEADLVPLTVGGAGELVARQVESICLGLAAIKRGTEEHAGGEAGAEPRPAGSGARRAAKRGTRSLGSRIQAAAVRGSLAIYMQRKRLVTFKQIPGTTRSSRTVNRAVADTHRF